MAHLLKIDQSGIFNMGSRDGAVVRVLASHQCGPGSTPGPGVMCGLSLLLVLDSETFYSRYSSFPLYSKTNTSKFQFDLGDLCSQLAFCAKYC